MENKKNNAITLRSQNFAQWYTDVCENAKLFTYASVKGMINYLPNSWSIWEKITKILDNDFKKHGIENVYCPLFIKMSDFNKEKKHIEGFAPESFIIEKIGNEQIPEPLIVRPTSEVLFSQMFNSILKNYKNLPLKYNQWCSVVRAEKTTKPFLRGSELIWHEAHHIFASAEEALDDVKKMRDIYNNFLKDYCCLAFISGQKTEGEKFAGAIATYTREIWSQDNQFIQTGTNHYFGTNFSSIYGLKFQDVNNEYKMPFYTTHGITQRIIGDLIVVHGDDNGLVLPFKIAQKQVIISPLFADRDKNVLVKANEIKQLLQDNGINCFIDDSDKSFGFKINNSEVLGTPFFIAFGPVDLNKNECILIRRDNHIKQTISLDKILSSIKEQALVYDKTLYDNSLNRLKDSIVVCDTMEECKKAINEQKIVLAPFAGSVEDEDKFKQLTQAKPRCILDKENFYLVKEKIKSIIPQNKKCIISNNPAKHYVFFGRQY